MPWSLRCDCCKRAFHKRTQYEEATTYGVGMLLEDLTDYYYVTHYLYRPYNPYPGEGDLFGIAYDRNTVVFLPSRISVRKTICIYSEILLQMANRTRISWEIKSAYI